MSRYKLKYYLVYNVEPQEAKAFENKANPSERKKLENACFFEKWYGHV